MTRPLITIDFVSDVSCPWCVIGLQSLRQALAQLHDTLDFQLRFQPFELNPDMPAEGQNIDEHLAQKYRIDSAQIQQNRDAIRQRGEALGFAFRMNDQSRIYNTFDAHRLLHWAGLPEQPATAQLALKLALFDAYFTQGQNPGDPTLLTALAGQCGLDATQAADVLASGRYADDVRAAEATWQRQGVRAVPAAILNGKFLVSGGQPVEGYVQALRSVAALPREDA